MDNVKDKEKRGATFAFFNMGSSNSDEWHHNRIDLRQEIIRWELLSAVMLMISRMHRKRDDQTLSNYLFSVFQFVRGNATNVLVA
jgi:hypothetical protein